MLAKVPHHIQVRLLRPLSENNLPRIFKEEEEIKEESLLLKAARKIMNGAAVSFVLGGGLYLIMKTAGLDFGSFETTIIIFLPALLGLLTTFILF